MENDCTLTIKEWIWITKRINFPRQQKVCFFLYYWYGMPQEDIAIKLGISRGAVGAHVFWARKRVKHLLIDRNY
jgi:DNA-directed RNA polymerase specialized sigma24 family protein